MMLGTVLIAVALLLLVVVLAYGAQRAMAARVLARNGSVGEAQSDEDNAIPAVLLIPDDSTPAGDSPDAHDEIIPQDLPLGHPGRQAAEEQAAEESAAESGTTSGDADPANAPPDGARG